MLQCLIVSVVYMSHVLELKESETCTWLQKVGLCSILVELCGNCAALSGSSQAGGKWQHWWLWERCLGKDSNQVLQLWSMRGRMPLWERLRPGLVFVWNKVSCLKVFLYTSQWCLPLFGPHTFICDQKHSSEKEWCSVFFAHTYIHLYFKAGNLINSP